MSESSTRGTGTPAAAALSPASTGITKPANTVAPAANHVMSFRFVDVRVLLRLVVFTVTVLRASHRSPVC